MCLASNLQYALLAAISLNLSHLKLCSILTDRQTEPSSDYAVHTTRLKK